MSADDELTGLEQLILDATHPEQLPPRYPIHQRPAYGEPRVLSPTRAVLIKFIGGDDNGPNWHRSDRGGDRTRRHRMGQVMTQRRCLDCGFLSDIAHCLKHQANQAGVGAETWLRRRLNRLCCHACRRRTCRRCSSNLGDPGRPDSIRTILGPVSCAQPRCDASRTPGGPTPRPPGERSAQPGRHIPPTTSDGGNQR
jgi:hypothetical protein